MDDAFETPSDSRTALPAISRSVFLAFIYWYIAVAPRGIVVIWGDYLAANLNYFSVAFLLRTLLAPWHRDTETYEGGFDIIRYLRAAIVNTISRIVGLLIRATTILIALAAEAGILASGLLSLLLWFLAPIILFLGLTQTPAMHLSVPQLPTLPAVHLTPLLHGIR